MEFDFFQALAKTMGSVNFMIMVLTVLLHLIFASAVAKDAGNLAKTKQEICLVSGMTWTFATLVGGVFVAVAYWFIHHSNLTRMNIQ